MLLKTILIVTLLICFIESIEITKPSTCAFPWTYKGKEYDTCIKQDSNYYWCSVYPIYNGTFSYCKVTGDDTITDEHFLQLMKKADEHAQKLKQLTEGTGKHENTCKGCIEVLKKVGFSIREISILFLDQNKRIQGLKEQHNNLDKTVDEIKKYYQMRRCKQTDNGGDYLGKVGVSIHGYKCQAWAVQTPNKHSMTESDRYSDNDIKLAGNNCRNPDLRSTPWCYTINSAANQESCHIPKCNTDCKIDDKDTSKLPMCDEFQSSTCPTGSTFYNNACYTIVSTPMTFDEAEKKCESMKGHLTSVHSSSENIFISKTLFPTGSSFWIGLNDKVKEGTYVFTDGSSKTYARFYSGEPNNAGDEDCIEVGRYPGLREAWNDIGCGSKRPFVCKNVL